nr:hypothetical protein [Tanacetum cinerariifolium]
MASTKRSWVRICLRFNIPYATSAADVAATWACETQLADVARPPDVAATWACETQLADVALPRRLTWDMHADVAGYVAT